MFAYLDDMDVIVPSARARVVFDLLSQHLFRHARIEAHQGKTRAWNAAGLEPPGIRKLASTDAAVRVGDLALPPEQQGLVALGVPCGHPAYVATQLQATRAKQDSLLQGIRSLPDLVAAFVLCFPALLSPRRGCRRPPFGFVGGRPRAPPCPAPFPARWPQPAVCGRSGRLLGLVGRHSFRAAPPALALRRRRCRRAWSRRARRPHPPRRTSVTGSACCGRV